MSDNLELKLRDTSGNPSDKNVPWGHNALTFDRDHEMLSALPGCVARPGAERTIEVWPVTDDMIVYHYDDVDGQYQIEHTDASGGYLPLTYALAGNLVKLQPSPSVNSVRNRAVLAFLAALPPDEPVVLYWR